MAESKSGSKSGSSSSKSKSPDEPVPDSSEDQAQGVGIAPTEPGDAGEGNPGTHFETTEEIEKAQEKANKKNGGDS